MTANAHPPSRDVGGSVAIDALLTIVIALRNNASGLRRSLESIIANGPAARRVCVHIVDSNSTDAPIEIADEFAGRLAIVFRSAHDHGIYHAWNKALRAVATPWLTFLGSGDTFAPDALEKLFHRFAEEPAFDIVTAKARLIYPSGRREVRGLPYVASQFARWFSISHSGACYDRRLFDRYGNFDETYRVTGDYDFLTRVGPHARFAFIDEVLSDFPLDGVSSTSLRPLKEAYRVRDRYRTVSRFENIRLFARAVVMFYAARWIK